MIVLSSETKNCTPELLNTESSTAPEGPQGISFIPYGIAISRLLKTTFSDIIKPSI